MFPRAKH